MLNSPQVQELFPSWTLVWQDWTPTWSLHRHLALNKLIYGALLPFSRNSHFLTLIPALANSFPWYFPGSSSFEETAECVIKPLPAFVKTSTASPLFVISAAIAFLHTLLIFPEHHPNCLHWSDWFKDYLQTLKKFYYILLTRSLFSPCFNCKKVFLQFFSLTDVLVAYLTFWASINSQFQAIQNSFLMLRITLYTTTHTYTSAYKLIEHFAILFSLPGTK